MADNGKCVVLVPVGNKIEPETDDALRILANRGYIVRVMRGSSQVDLARSTMATEALMDGFEETMWIDSDTAFDPDDVDKLREHNRPFVVGLYVQKGPKRFAGMFPADTGKVKFGDGGGLIRMDYVGFGFTFVRAEVYRAIQERMPVAERSCRGGYQGKMTTPYFRPMLVPEKDGLCYLSEDYSFTARATEAGFSPWADTTIRLGHMGRKEYTWDDLTYTPERLKSLEIELGATDWKFPTEVRGWLTDEEGAGLAMLARGKDVLEVGSYCGRSSICLGQTAKSLCCVDPFDCRDTPGEGDTYEEFSENLKRYEVKAKVFRNLFAEAPLNGDRFDLAFIDGPHDEASVTEDAARATKLLNPGGLLAFHDARPKPGHHDGGWHPGVTFTVNRLVEQGAELVQTFGTVAVIRPAPLSNSKEIAMSANVHEQLGKAYEQLGRKQELLESQDAAYQQILDLLAGVIGGKIAPTRIMVNLTDRSWQMAEQGQSPAMPGTINGLPVCVVAPNDLAAEIESLKMDRLKILGAIRAVKRGVVTLDELEVTADSCEVKLRSKEVAEVAEVAEPVSNGSPQ